MKILVVTNMYPSPTNPTYGVFVEEQVNAILRRHPTVSIDVFFIDPQTHGKLTYLKTLKQIREKIDNGGYDLVHIHYGLSGLFLLSRSWRCKVPVVLTLHGGDILPEQGKMVQVALTRQILRRVDCAIVLNDRMAMLAADYAPRVENIPCAVNTDIFLPPKAARPMLKGKINLEVIFPSAHTRKVKNYPLFQKVTTELQSCFGLKINEIELNAMSRCEIASAMVRADLLLLTSISEGSPQVVKEALATNLPVVSTAVGDVANMLNGVENCAWGDADQLTSLCLKVIHGEIHGLSGRDKIFALGLDEISTSQRLFNLYVSLIKIND